MFKLTSTWRKDDSTFGGWHLSITRSHQKVSASLQSYCVCVCMCAHMCTCALSGILLF